MRPFALAAVLVLAACDSKALRVRSLGLERAQGWKLEVTGIRAHDKQEGGLLAPTRDTWTVTVAFAAHKENTHAALGTPFSVVVGTREAADGLLDELALGHCSDGERVLLRLQAKEVDPRWHLFVASPRGVAVQTLAVSGDTCAAALKAAPTAEAWLEERLRTPVAAFPAVKLTGAMLGQDPFPKPRWDMATLRVSPLMLAVREKRATRTALDFMLDQLSGYDELVQWKVGGDAYGPYDVLADERAAVTQAVRDDPALQAHLRERGPPKGPPQVVAWFEALTSTAASPAPPSTPPGEPASPR